MSPRFKSLLQNRPAAENTCIEISHVKYNIFHVGSALYLFSLIWQLYQVFIYWKSYIVYGSQESHTHTKKEKRRGGKGTLEI